MQHLNGKVVLITGGGSGMGRQAAQLCAAAGATVALMDVDEAGMEVTRELGDNIHAYPSDTSDFGAVQAAVNAIESSLGPIYRIYNAAGGKSGVR